MAAKRLQQKGDLYKQGGWWKLRWREDQIDAEGKTAYKWSKPVWIGPAEGRGRLTEKNARRIAWDNFLSRLDHNMRTPQSIMTVREFVDRKFKPEHVAMLKPGGRVHYSTQLLIVLDGIPEVKRRQQKKPKDGPIPEVKRIFGIGEMRLRDVSTEDCQRLVSAALSRGYAVGYATHIRNCISAIFEHAESKDWFSGRNPAKRVKLPENVTQPNCALTFEELKTVAGSLDPMTRAMAVCASLTSMNVAEMCGLRWKYMNLSDEWRTVDGESLTPWTLAVRSQWTLGQLGTVKAKKRRRFVVIPKLLVRYLSQVGLRKEFKGPDDFVFTVTGKPVDAKNLLRRRLVPLGKKLGLKLGWHTFRRTFDTLADQVGMSLGERQAVMGHSDAAMTQRYTKTPYEQTRERVETMGKLIDPGELCPPIVHKKEVIN